MPRPPAAPTLAWETLLDLGDSTAALRDRLEGAIREAVQAGRIPAGAALPPSRTLAETLGVSRWVVTEAYGQLVAEGLLDATVGAATRVAAGSWHPPTFESADSGSVRAEYRRPTYDLGPGVPDLRHVP
ncbi:GntR family transcriptional regulator, partial [Agromyces humi]|uniref:GntR family transcriptional regulator n=1 Tax=Agromyces humi TaxID=1766800 RepID=UPI00135A047F